MPAAIPAIGAGTSLIGGWLGGRGASQAAKIQAAAAQQAANNLTQTAERTSADLEGATRDIYGNIIDTAGAAANATTDAAGAGAAAITDAGNAAAAGAEGAATASNATLADLYQQILSGLDPYKTAGAGAISNLASLLAPDGEFSKGFQFNPNEDPGYQFRLQEGQKALERSAAARGALVGGGTMKALSRYAQGVVSDEFGKSFDRFQTERNARFGMLRDLAGFGERANTQQIQAASEYGSGVSQNNMRGAELAGGFRTGAARDAGDLNLRGTTAAGQFRTNAAQNAGQLWFNSRATQGDWRNNAARGAAEATMGGANALAAGRVGSANAWSGAISGAGNALASWMARQPKFNPALKGGKN